MNREYKIALSQEYYSDIVYLSQYDSDYDLVFSVLDKYSKATQINGYTAKFQGTRTDGLGFLFEGTASDDRVAFRINTSLTAISGTHKGEIVFYDASGLFYGSANVQIVVEPAARPDGTIDADVERAEEIAEQIQQIVDTAAEQTTAEAERIVADLEEDVTELKSGLNRLNDGGLILKDDVIAENVNDWLDEHPEATTSLQDGAVTTPKLANDAVTNSKLAAGLKKPWYKLTDITMFGRVASANLPVIDSYPEAITYDTNRNLIYIATYDYSDSANTAEIIAINADTLQVANTYYYSFGTIGALSYNPKTDQIYVAITGGVYKLYAINAETMESLGELTDKVFSAGVQYDIDLGVNVALQLSGTTAEIRTYDDNFDQIARYTVPIEPTDTVQQDFCAKNGILYICTWSSILEIDYVNGLINRVGLAGFSRGNEEPEGTCFVGDELYLLSFRAGTDGKFELFKYGFTSIVNLTNSSLYNSYALNISSIVEEYPTLFSFIQSMNVGDTAHLYHYSPTGNFSDLPTLYSGNAWISEIYVNRSTQALEYTQIELSMHRVASDQNVWKRWRGIIKNSNSVSITWAEYQMANPLAMGMAIPSGSNLNDYTASGVYAVTSSSIASNISNMPVAGPGRLEVRESIASGTGTFVVQTFYRTNTTACEIYHRVKTTDATGFGAWNKVSYAS